MPASELYFSIRKNFLTKKVLISLFNVQIQVSTSRSTATRASMAKSMAKSEVYGKIGSLWRTKHLSG